MSSPQFYHTTVLLKEAVDGLAIKADGIYVDATFGGGGHSKAILAQLGSKGRLFAFDQDKDAWRNKPEDERLTAITENFRHLKRFLRLHGVAKVDGILADLGVSSYQFDTAERGFSIRYDGPLDMRMDYRMELTAADILAKSSEKELHKMFEQYGEVRNAKQLAQHIVAHRNKGGLNSIASLKALIAPVVKGIEQRYLAQVFQALRIKVNDEFGALKDLLEQSAQCLNPAGRLSIITFHSLEDRIVKQFVKNGGKENEDTGLLGNEKRAWCMKPVFAKPIEPAAEEIKNNPRARSAKLRIAEHI